MDEKEVKTQADLQRQKQLEALQKRAKGIDKRFERWIEEFQRGKERLKKSDIWNKMKGYDAREEDLLYWYIQYKLEKANKALVWSTSILSAATIILAVALIFILKLAF